MFDHGPVTVVYQDGNSTYVEAPCRPTDDFLQGTEIAFDGQIGPNRFMYKLRTYPREGYSETLPTVEDRVQLLKYFSQGMIGEAKGMQRRLRERPEALRYDND